MHPSLYFEAGCLDRLNNPRKKILVYANLRKNRISRINLNCIPYVLRYTSTVIGWLLVE